MLYNIFQDVTSCGMLRRQSQRVKEMHVGATRQCTLDQYETAYPGNRCDLTLVRATICRLSPRRFWGAARANLPSLLTCLGAQRSTGL